HHEGPGGGQVAAGVVAEARPGTAEPRREELGQVEAERARDPVDGEPVQEEEPHAHDRVPVEAERDPDRRSTAGQVEREERTPAGSSPGRKSTRQARSGCAASRVMSLVRRSLTSVARKMPSGELV